LSTSKNKKRLLSRDYRRNKHVKNLLDEYRREETNEGKRSIRLKVAEKLGVGLDEFEIMEVLGEDFEISVSEDGIEMSQTEIDMCKIWDKVSEDKLDKLFPLAIPITIDIAKEMNIIAYPVSIDINKFATKKDVVKFIESNWKKIEKIQIKNGKPEKLFIKSRSNEKRDNFIYKYWEKETLKGKKLREIVADLHGANKKIIYPGKIVDYNEIRGIIRRENKRRNKKIV
jgi:hypothetical protein